MAELASSSPGHIIPQERVPGTLQTGGWLVLIQGPEAAAVVVVVMLVAVVVGVRSKSCPR
jgi:hypothetical protein